MIEKSFQLEKKIKDKSIIFLREKESKGKIWKIVAFNL